jgi:hypothetical protein
LFRAIDQKISTGDEANSSVVNVDTVEEVDPRGTAASQTSQPGADLHKAPESGTSTNGIRKMIPKCVSYIYIDKHKINQSVATYNMVFMG